MKTLFDPSAIVLGAYQTLARTGFLETDIYKRAYTSAYFAYKRLFDDCYRHLARSHPEIFLSGHIVDVGANIGYTASVFADALQDGYQVFAFEPEKEAFSLMLQCIVDGGLEREIVPVAAAAGECNGSAQLWLNNLNPTDRRIVTEDYRKSLAGAPLSKVPLVSIDSFLSDRAPAQPVAFVKIDVEGYEPLVCAGMKGTLARHESVCVAFDYCPVLLEQSGFDPPLLLDFFLKRGFRLFLIEKNGKLQTLSSAQLARTLSARTSMNLLASRRDLNTQSKSTSRHSATVANQAAAARSKR